MEKVSIVMPVYHVEKYVGEAIQSVLAQTYPDFELLLVNDRSTDRSKEICEEYAKKDSRIVLLENDSGTHGPGPTRNLGLEHMSGDYVYFMDADDWIDPRLLKRAVSRMKETGADMVQFGAVYEGEDGQASRQYVWPGKDVLTKDDMKANFSHFWAENRNSLWLYCFCREILNGIRFEPIISSEDFSFIMDVFCKSEKISFIKDALYHYRCVAGSVSHRWNDDTIGCLAVLWQHQRKFLGSLQGDMSAYTAVAYHTYLCAIQQLSSSLCPLSYKEKRRELQNLEKQMEFQKYRGSYALASQHGLQKVKYALVKYGLEGALLRVAPIFLRIVRGE